MSKNYTEQKTHVILKGTLHLSELQSDLLLAEHPFHIILPMKGTGPMEDSEKRC